MENKYMTTMWQNILLRTAKLIDDHNKDMCWAELVMWSLGHRSFWGLFWKYHDGYSNYRIQACRKSNMHTPFAYCGKCEENGNFYK